MCYRVHKPHGVHSSLLCVIKLWLSWLNESWLWTSALLFLPQKRLSFCKHALSFSVSLVFVHTLFLAVISPPPPHTHTRCTAYIQYDFQDSRTLPEFALSGKPWGAFPAVPNPWAGEALLNERLSSSVLMPAVVLRDGRETWHQQAAKAWWL